MGAAETRLEQIFSDSSPTPEAPKASPEPKAEPEKAEAAAVEPEKKEEAPAKEPEAEPKAEAKPEKVEAKPEAKPPEEKKAETPPKTDWETDENPYKKRYADTRDWATRVNSDAAELRRQLEIVNAKLDGTYDPEKYKTPEPTPEQKEGQAEIRGKIKASEVQAYQQYGGKEKVEAKLKQFNEKFGENQLVQYRVLNSAVPIVEAMKVMREVEIVEKYGSEDADIIIGKIKEETRAELEAELTEKITKQLMARLDKQEKAAPSLTGIRGGEKPDGKGQKGPTPLTSIFS